MTAIGPGTRVKCIKPDGPWPDIYGRPIPEPARPAFGSIWTVRGIIHDEDGEWVSLEGWALTRLFGLKYFRPLDGDSELERLREIAMNPKKVIDWPLETV